MQFCLITPKRCDANLTDAMKISWINTKGCNENFEIKTQRCNVKSNEGMEISTFYLRTCNANKMVAIAHIGLSYEN